MLPGARILFGRRAAPALPYDAEVAYLQATGTQYVKIDVLPANTHVIRTRFKADDVPASGTNPVPGSFLIGLSQTGCIAANGNILLMVSGTTTRRTGDTDWHDVEFRLAGSAPSAWLDGERVVERSSAWVAPNANQQAVRYFLFARGTVAGTPMDGDGIGRIASFSIEDAASGDKIVDLIPVRKDGVGYLYDRVSGDLLGNGGTGEFVIGPDKT